MNSDAMKERVPLCFLERLRSAPNVDVSERERAFPKSGTSFPERSYDLDETARIFAT